jgi:predicted ATP-dependent endonuclease of OLD family
MKIKKIELKGYNQFKDVEIDLTYPKSHEKEGNPLDKVCIIGQSGTGKSSLLRLIKWYISEDRNIDGNLKVPFPPKGSVEMDIQYNVYGYTISYQYNKLKYNDKSIQRTSNERLDVFPFPDTLKKIKPLLINYPADLPSDMGIKSESGDGLTAPPKIEPQQIIDFAFEDIRKIWIYILKDIKEYRTRELSLRNQIAETATKEASKMEEIEEKTREYKEWKANNPSPLEMLARKCLDPILHNIGLRTKTDIDENTIRNLEYILLQTLANDVVPMDFWSTGTRQLVQTMIPLYQLKPEDAIILMDEPERSLYPDIQRSIIDVYVKLAPKCQFFFATHSPIIASAFEPWEIVELKFDNEHKYVYRDLYYEGENHIDNYKYYPQYLRWDSILRHIFELEEEGYEKRIDALEELTEIMSQIKKLKDKGKLDSPEGKKLVEQYLALGVKLDWRVEGDE